MSRFTPEATLMADFYKVSHRIQYPAKTEKVYSTWTPRASRINGVDKVVCFGVQSFIKEYIVDYFNDNFFKRPIEDVVKEYTRVIKYALQDPNPDASHIKALHELGYLPIEIKAVPEGTLIPIRCPMLTIENTLPEFFWLTNYLETLMSCELWMPMTSATIALQYRKLLNEWAKKTNSDMIGFVPWQGHDFSMRGMSSIDSAAKSGAGHLLSFYGTDTIPAISYLEQYYGANIENELVGGSVPATEHSVMCAGGKEDEYETFRRIVTELYSKGIVSIVSDTWDLWHVLSNTIPSLKNEIMKRDGKLTIRPDCYDENTMLLTNSGWKFFKDLNENDLVAEVKEDCSYTFVKPLKIISQYYEGDMYSFKDGKGKLDLLVTPNHRMIFSKNNTIHIEEADKIKLNIYGKNIIRSAMSLNTGKKLTDEERLKIAFQADGSYCTNMNSTIRFSFSKQRKINRIIDIINRLGWNYKIYDLKDSRKEIHISCNANDFKKDFNWIDTSNLCNNWCKEFIEELSYWDATRRSDDRFKFDTAIKEVIDVVELIGLAAGYGILISKYIDNRKDYFQDIYTAHIFKNNNLGGQAISKEKIKNFKGMVYCVKVPSGMILVKRNRGTAICGNSGDPVDIICGDESLTNPSARKGVIEILWDIFGGTITKEGYKQLDPHIGCIYGDAITIERCTQICERLAKKGFASTNMVYGIGSFSYQYQTRDTFGFALKSTYVVIDGKEINIFKDPVTDNGIKKSQTGKVAVIESDMGIGCVDGLNAEQENKISYIDGKNILETVFKDGYRYNIQNLTKIRERISNNF